MGQGAQVSCTATIFYMHTPAYVALIFTQICPIFILMKVYCMCAYNIWCHKNGLCRRTSPRPSHVLDASTSSSSMDLRKTTKRKKSRKPQKPKKKQQQRGRARTREGTGQPRGPPKRFPRGKPETGQHITKQHEATGGAVHLLACTAASMGDVHIDDFLFAMCVTLWGWDA